MRMRRGVARRRAASTRIRQVFDWFNATAGSERAAVRSAFVPGVNIQILEPLKSPYADRVLAGTSRQLGSRGTLRVDGVWREYHNFYSQRDRPRPPGR